VTEERRSVVTKHDLKRVMDEVDELDLPDGAYWALVHERLGLEPGDAFDIIAEDPAFFSKVRGMTKFFKWYWAWFFS
jgi:hypothetical protein